jgi:undecaprenyl-diphosphatase
LPRLSSLERHEITTILLIAAISAGIWIFVAIGSEVREGGTLSLDTAILLSMRSHSDTREPLGPQWFQEAARDVTAMGGVTILSFVTLVVCGFLVIERKSQMARFLALSVVSGMLVSMALKDVYRRPRPELVPPGAYVYGTSFPSGHSMMSALTYLTLGALLARAHPRRRVKIYVLSLSIIVTIAVGLSRIYLGVHWPTDVAAGWTAGSVWAAVCWTAAKYLQTRRSIEAEAGPVSEPD